MFNNRGAGPFDDACPNGNDGCDWLIVERFQKTLFVGQGNIASECRERRSDAAAPHGLTARCVMVAHHIWSNTDATSSKFLLSSNSSEAEAHEGTFLPACGVVTLSGLDGRIGLQAVGQMLAYNEFADCTDALCDPRFDTRLPIRSRRDQSWGFSAEYRNWLYERLSKSPVAQSS